jgi:putative polymerase
LLYLPGALMLSAIIVTLFGLQYSGDNLSGRVAGSIDFLANLDMTTLLGAGVNQVTDSADSGISYFLITQSIFGLAAVWLLICLVPRYHDRRATILIHSICIYFSGNLLVSYSLFSIKTAALMWFLYGYLLPEIGWQRAKLQKYLAQRSQQRGQQPIRA